MTTTVEYTQYVDTREKIEKFYNAFINTDSKKSKKYIPFLEKSFASYTYNRLSDPSRVDVANSTTLLSVNNFAALQSQALRGNMNHSVIAVISNATQKNSNTNSTGFLNFTRSDTDTGFTPVPSVADKYQVLISIKRANLIYASIEIIEIFISILEAYKKVISNNQEKNIPMTNIQNIFILGTDVKKSANRHQEDNTGVYLTHSLSVPETGFIHPNVNSLFLIIKSFKNDIMNDTDTTATNTKYLTFYKRFFKFDNASRSADSVLSPAVQQDGLFSDLQTGLSPNSTFLGIKISKNDADQTIMYNNEPFNITDESDLGKPTNNDIKHGTNKQLCSIILKNFLYYLFEIDALNINFQINSLLYYYKIMKCYLLNSVFAGNYLFNTRFQNGKTLTNTPLSSLVAINPMITNNTKITDPFINTVSTSTHWEYLIATNSIINNTVNRLTKDIDDNIQGNNISNNSIKHPVLYKGFYVKKISDTIIELSPITNSLTNDIANRPFPNHLQQYTSVASINKPLLTSFNSVDSNLSKEETHLANIIKSDSLNNINKHIISEYQIEINNNLYTIDKIFTEKPSGTNTIKGISKIHILAKFEYSNSNDITNTSKIFKFERNTYDVFNDNTNITPQNIVDARNLVKVGTVFSDDGKVKNSNVIDGRYVLLYNYSEHPVVNNHVIFHKNVNLKKTYNEDIDKIKDINKKIIYNETKINNSGRLYDIQDTEYSILYNQLMIYYVVIAVLCCIIIIINYADIGADFITHVTSGCFITIIMLIISYYIVDIAYIEKYANVENFMIEHFNTMESFRSNSGFDELSKINAKVSNIQAIMNATESKISGIIDILMVSIPQVEFTATNKILNKIVENEKNEKIFVNKNLDHKRINAYNFIDVKKYDIIALNTLIKTVLAIALVIFGFYTLHFYVNKKYHDILIFLCAIVLITIFAYYIIHSNRIVRTVSTNQYWGKEFESSYM